MMLAVCVLGLSSAHAAVATWDFSGSTPYNGAISGGSEFTGTPTLTVVSGGIVTTPTTGGNPGGFLLIAGSAAQLNSSTLSFVLTPSGSISLSTFSFDFYLTSGKSPTSINWAIIAGGTGSIASSPLGTTTGQWVGSGPISLAGIALSSGSITIRGTMVDGNNGSAGGDIQFDNFAITAVPEPTNYALAVFGVCVVGVGAARRFVKKAQA